MCHGVLAPAWHQKTPWTLTCSNGGASYGKRISLLLVLKEFLRKAGNLMYTYQSLTINKGIEQEFYAAYVVGARHCTDSLNAVDSKRGIEATSASHPAKTSALQSQLYLERHTLALLLRSHASDIDGCLKRAHNQSSAVSAMATTERNS